MMRLLLIDDHTAFREALGFMLSREPDITIIGQAGSLAEARPFLPDTQLLIVDLDLPDGYGIDLIHEAFVINPSAIALVLTASMSRKDLARAIEAGAVGVLSKTVRIETLLQSLRQAHQGQQLLSPQETIELLRFANAERTRERLARDALAHLTAREREVLRALASGLNDKGIARQLSISSETVRSHITGILTKLRAESRLEALVFALRHGGVTIE